MPAFYANAHLLTVATSFRDAFQHTACAIRAVYMGGAKAIASIGIGTTMSISAGGEPVDSG